MGTYPLIRDKLNEMSSPAEEKSWWSMFAAGMMGGCLGFSVSAPIFQIKTRSQAFLTLFHAV